MKKIKKKLLIKMSKIRKKANLEMIPKDYLLAVIIMIKIISLIKMKIIILKLLMKKKIKIFH